MKFVSKGKTKTSGKQHAKGRWKSNSTDSQSACYTGGCFRYRGCLRTGVTIWPCELIQLFKPSIPKIKDGTLCHIDKTVQNTVNISPLKRPDCGDFCGDCQRRSNRYKISSLSSGIRNFGKKNWWSWWESNPLPIRCERIALAKWATAPLRRCWWGFLLTSTPA